MQKLELAELALYKPGFFFALYFQAYPEYLITYQIVKPEAPSQTATAAEQKT